MKFITLTFILLLFFQLKGNAQTIEPSLASKLTINNICVCQVTLPQLKGMYTDLKEVDVEEMDLAKGCYGQDSRFIAGKGYASEKQQGMVFQTEQGADLISKIRLTNKFKGKLPDGNQVDMSKLVLGDLFKMYPDYKNKWNSRGCSGYWRFSNDTIAFYVKIDKSKIPQFPIDEAYYLNKPVEAVDLIVSCSAIQSYSDGYHVMEVNTEPVFYIDSVRIQKSGLKAINPENIAIVSVVKDSVQLKKYHVEAEGKLIFMETKGFAKQRYWRYFCSKSPEYAKLVTAPGNDSSIQYILNKRILTKNAEGDLAMINDVIFKEIRIIAKDQLIKDYGVTNKDYGVVITSNIPADLHNGKRKF